VSAAAHDGVAAANRQLFLKLVAIAVLMFGFGYALVPIYEKICEVTGIRSLLKADRLPANTQVDLGRSVTVELDSNIRGLPWTFRPVAGSVVVHPGELTTVEYEVRNVTDRPITGQAIPSYAPDYAAEYFKKLECFCFQQQTLAPGEVRRFPVVFVVDAALPKDVNTISLSYTFFEVAGRQGKSG
jgi:cytochrome c oxidase assembly protein subunit 11